MAYSKVRVRVEGSNGAAQVCVALIKNGLREGQRCSKYALNGSTFCYAHGRPHSPNTIIARARKVEYEKARHILMKLVGGDRGLADRVDPKEVLLDSVRSAWYQRQFWDQMLASIPEEDWDALGSIPIAGIPSSARGARAEVIQRLLADATKVAVRSSKLAIDAGIEERLVRLAEEQSALIADTVRAGLVAGIGTLRLSPAAEEAAISQALGSAASHLRVLAAGGNSLIEGIAEEVVER